MANQVQVGVNADLYNLYLDASQHAESPDTVFLRRTEANGEVNNETRAWTKWKDRDSDFVERSLQTRQHFYNAISRELDSMGVNTAKIPKAILDSLKLGDFDVKEGVVRSGKPLTARRIILATQAIAAYKQALLEVAHTAVSEGVRNLKQADGNTPLKFTSHQLRTMEEMVLRDLSRRDAEKLPLPDKESIKQAFANGTHPALRYVTGVAQMGVDAIAVHVDQGAQQWNVLTSLAVYSGGKDAAEVRDRQDLMNFICPAHKQFNAISGSAAQIFFGCLCEKRAAMRALQPAGTIRFDTVWKACFGKPLPSNLAKADDATRQKALTQALGEALARLCYGPLASISADDVICCLARIGQGVLSGIKPSVQAQVVASTLWRDGPKPPTVEITEKDLIGAPFGLGVTDVAAKPEDTIKNGQIGDWKRDHLTIIVSGNSFEMKGPSEAAEVDYEALQRQVAEEVAKLSENDVQKKAVMLNLTQAGYGLVMAHLPENEKANRLNRALDVSVSKRDDGAVLMKFSTKPLAPTELSATFVVKPDGTSRLLVDKSHRRDSELARILSDHAIAEPIRQAMVTRLMWADGATLSPKDLLIEATLDAGLGAWEKDQKIPFKLTAEEKTLVREMIRANREMGLAQEPSVELSANDLYESITSLKDLGVVVALSSLGHSSLALEPNGFTWPYSIYSLGLRTFLGIRDPKVLTERLRVFRPFVEAAEEHVKTTGGPENRPQDACLWALIDLLPTLQRNYPTAKVYTLEMLMKAFDETLPPSEEKILPSESTAGAFVSYLRNAMARRLLAVAETHKNTLSAKPIYKSFFSDQGINPDFSDVMVGRMSSLMHMGLSFSSALDLICKGLDSHLTFVASVSLYPLEDAVRQVVSGELLKSYKVDFNRQKIEIAIGDGDERLTYKIDHSAEKAGEVYREVNREVDHEAYREVYDKYDAYLKKQGVTDSQRYVALTGLIQSALNVFLAFGLSEHADCKISVSMMDGGAVQLHYQSPDGASPHLSYSFVVQRDGSSALTGISVKQRVNEAV